MLIVGISKNMFIIVTQNTVLGPDKVIKSDGESSSELSSAARRQ